MADNKMLIDAAHPEETRVVVLRGGRVEEFDYESAARKLLRGNIYLAKVTRVEPALQAAFVEYGGNRHGFLAFNEIHPDYYQIPVADRIALIEEEAAAEAAEEAAVDALAEQQISQPGADQPGDISAQSDVEPDLEIADGPESDATSGGEDENGGLEERADGAESSESEVEEGSEGEELQPDPDTVVEDGARTLAQDVGEDPRKTEAPESDAGDELAANAEAGDDDVDEKDDELEDGDADTEEDDTESVQNGDSERVEEIGTADALEEVSYRPRRHRRSYKIQEVIKRRQVLLVQVVKEERGNKGAALTTYLSLAGRYTVLMPNTARGGGISRKITNPPDRKRMKAIADGLDVPEGMGLIIRTAGASRTKQEIRRDFEYLLRLWESVRQLTFESSAPNLVYEEGNLIKRSIRDLYNKEVDEIVVAGDHAHKEAKSFMRMLMPSHARNVTTYKDPEPLFTKFQIERQLNAMFSPHVPLRSGGYLVINQTEALVSIDVNSGRSTREFSIEETALHTNLEASEEIARQLKLRDLAGLIVIDFIDMEERRNNRAVERRIKDVLRNDRARVQVGRISHFGLLEMSRQRMRTGVLEGSTSQCPHCQGTGIIRSTESVALAVLRALEDAVMSGVRSPLVAQTTANVALYIFNHKREFINDMQARHGLPIMISESDKMTGAAFTIEKGASPVQARSGRTSKSAVNMDWGFADDGTSSGTAEQGEEDAPRKRRRRRRGGRRGERGEAADRQLMREDQINNDDGSALDESGPRSRNGGRSPAANEGFSEDAATEQADLEVPDGAEESVSAESPSRKGRRRGRRGGRRNRERRLPARESDESVTGNGEVSGEDIPGSGPQPSIFSETPSPESGEVAITDDQHRAEPVEVEADAQSVPEPAFQADAPVVKPVGETAEAASLPSEPQIERIIVSTETSGEEAEGRTLEDASAGTADGDASKPTRKGWWQRRSFGDE